MPGGPLLRLRHRRRAARCARGRLAHVDVGPERRFSVDLRPTRGRRRGGRARVAARAARPARGVSRRLRHRLPDGAHDRARGRPPPCARAGGLGRRRATVCTERRRSASSSASERHVTVDRAAALARHRHRRRSSRSPSDEQGRMRRRTSSGEALEAGHGPTIVCAQAGDVNSGAFDPLEEIADACDERRGLAARRRRLRALGGGVSPRFRHLVAGPSGQTRGRPMRTSG